MMRSTSLKPDDAIALFVKEILVFEDETNRPTALPFFADGYPGMLFQDTPNGLVVQPHNKQMPLLFLYGQTLHPIELQLQGRYQLIVFQLYPFILKSFFDVSAIDVNDNCHDLKVLEQTVPLIGKLQQTQNLQTRIELLGGLLLELFNQKQQELDLPIKKAIQLIIDHNGLLPIGQVCEKTHLAQRTFERRFLAATGLSAKHFSKIIQFQQSLGQLTSNEYGRLTDIVYRNGFADQSHFIRVFKAFTGKTPKDFIKT